MRLQSRTERWLLLSLVMTALLGFYMSHRPVPMSIAVVDFDHLLARHPDYPKLQKMDAEMDRLDFRAKDFQERRKIAEQERARLYEAMSSQIAVEAAQVAAHNKVGMIIRNPVYSHGLTNVTAEFKL